MKSKATKVVKIVAVIVGALVLALATCLIVQVVSCSKTWGEIEYNYYQEKEVGDFVVRFYDEGDCCDIVGTTEQGNSKANLVLPAYIDGVRVDALGVYWGLNYGNNDYLQPEIESDVLEKVYFESAIKVSEYSFDDTQSLPNLKKVLYPDVEEYPYCMNRSDEVTYYYPRSVYDGLESKTGVSPANVTFYYNIGEAGEDSVYWIDDCDYGGKIEYMPSDPSCDGATFDGWYTGSDCVTKWDFDVDTLPQVDAGSADGYVETALYAKWVQCAVS